MTTTSLMAELTRAEQLPIRPALRRWSLAVGVAAGVLMLVGLAVDPPQFFRAYLAAWLWCLNIALGATVLLTIYHLTGGAWGFLIRRLCEAASQTLPLLAIGFLPIALGIGQLYLWAQPDTVAASKLIESQRPWMSPLWWYVRAAIYLACG